MSLDAVEREVMAHAFAGVAEEMGLVLIHSAVSPNIRERRDASAALFDSSGAMIAQAAHIPVHLGALGDAVAAVRAEAPPPGALYILNDPFSGGSHLPDLTLVQAIRMGEAIGGFCAVRAHHSDVGGATPGSMPAGARELYAEGLILPAVPFTRDVERVLLANVRTPDVRRADLAAQRAAVERGAMAFTALAARYGWGYIEEAARNLMDDAETLTRAALRRANAHSENRVVKGAGSTAYQAIDYLEGDGVIDADLPIAVTIAVRDGVLHADFTGTAPAAAGNVNCPLAVTRAAVLFVVQTLVGEDVPMNAGVARAVRVTAPEGCLVNARRPSAVAAGNVETSQRIADVVFLALANGGIPVPAQGQGTMNNITLGGTGRSTPGRRPGVSGASAVPGAGLPSWTYYETLGGGQGASPSGPGPSGVHVGMSNTRNTPIEVVELEYPLRVRSYRLLAGSGGSGRMRGGDGVIREIELLAPAEASLLTERRRRGGQGVAGASGGAPGRNLLNGAPLPAKVNRRLETGDVLRIETPGGGGWGREAKS